MTTSRLRTRSSAATQPTPAPPLPGAPATRSRKTSTVVVEATSTKRVPVPWASGSAAPPTRTAAKAAPKPLWNSAKINAAAGEGEGTPRSRPPSAAGQHKPGPAPRATFSVPPAARASVSTSVDLYDPTHEPIQAFLRIRPAPLNIANTANYIHVISDTEIHMVPPPDHRLNPSSTSSSLFAAASTPTTSDFPPSLAPQGTAFKFTKVFPSTSDAARSQRAFFTETALPLVRDFLVGQNCLLFAYGPTGSGKTWTVQGGEGENAGLLPRVMDVVWASLKGKESKSQLRPSRFAGVEMSPPQPSRRGGGPATSTPNKGSNPFASPPPFETQVPDIIPVDDDYEYSIFVSYAEVYNEKIYDLLQAPHPAPSPSISSTASSSSWGAKAKAFGLKGFATVTRNALSLKSDKAPGQKYVAGMEELRIHSAEEARSILDRGQVNRRVYSTLANRVSSRSHSVFTIKIIKIHKGADPSDEAAVTTSRFSIVDLAGSERVVNTGTTGDRLKEAGNINKSLMVLGQCMEVLRKNQELEKGRKPAIVPFRHSKLTELFQSFFVGDGKAVMVVNVNPYDTGFDENSHVMKFSAVAKGVLTAKDQRPVVVPLPPKEKEVRVVRLSMVEGEEEEDVIYEEEDAEDDDETEEDEFVNALIDDLNAMRTALYEAELRASLAASQARAAVSAEYGVKIAEIHAHYQKRLREEALFAEEKLDAKLENLSQFYRKSRRFDDSDDEGEEEEEDVKGTVDQIVIDAERYAATEVYDSPAAQAGERAHVRGGEGDADSPLPAPTGDIPMLGESALVDQSSEVAIEQEEGESDSEGEESLEEVPPAGSEEDEYAEDTEDIEEEEEEEEDEFVPPTKVPSPRKAPSPKKAAPAALLKGIPVLIEDWPAPAPAKKKEVGGGEVKKDVGGGESHTEEEDEDDIYDLDKSVVLSKSTHKAKKPKRKLGGHHVAGADEIAHIAEAFLAGAPPIGKSASNRSIVSKTGSVRSRA